MAAAPSTKAFPVSWDQFHRDARALAWRLADKGPGGAPFATRGVSMSKFESRPSKVAVWDYLFFVDIEGHQADENVAAALGELRKVAGYVKVLGSYPVAVI